MRKLSEKYHYALFIPNRGEVWFLDRDRRVNHPLPSWHMEHSVVREVPLRGKFRGSINEHVCSYFYLYSDKTQIISLPMRIEHTNLISKSQSEILYVLTGLPYQSNCSSSHTTVSPLLIPPNNFWAWRRALVKKSKNKSCSEWPPWLTKLKKLTRWTARTRTWGSPTCSRRSLSINPNF